MPNVIQSICNHFALSLALWTNLCCRRAILSSGNKLFKKDKFHVHKPSILVLNLKVWCLVCLFFCWHRSFCWACSSETGGYSFVCSLPAVFISSVMVTVLSFQPAAGNMNDDLSKTSFGQILYKSSKKETIFVGTALIGFAIGIDGSKMQVRKWKKEDVWKPREQTPYIDKFEIFGGKGATGIEFRRRLRKLTKIKNCCLFRQIFRKATNQQWKETMAARIHMVLSPFYGPKKLHIFVQTNFKIDSFSLFWYG